MPHQYTRTDQVKFLTEWFDTWSELQKDDFLPIMAQVLNPGDHVNGLVGGVTSLRVGERRPSLFDCQVKLFQDWYENWTPSEKERLLHHFTESDPEFADKLQNYQKPHNIVEQNPQIMTAVHQDRASTSPISHDDGLVPESHSSSPLSSLSQPLSPHDSGLEENHSDLENTPALSRSQEPSAGTESRPDQLSADQEEMDSVNGVEESPSSGIMEDLQESV